MNPGEDPVTFVNNRLSRMIRNMPRMRTTPLTESHPVDNETESASDDTSNGEFDCLTIIFKSMKKLYV